MSTWLALAFASLPLQLAQRALDPALARTLAMVVVDGAAQRAVVLACSHRASEAGIVPGMKLAAAQALARDLAVVVHDAQRERSALQELACWAYQFSAQIALFPPQEGSGLSIEIGASLRLFGGQAALCRRILEGLRRLGYRAGDASAGVAAAARLLARARAGGSGAPTCGCARAPGGPEALRAALSPLPLELLGWEESAVQTLHTLGQRTIGDLWALPRPAFARRFGARCLLAMDRLLGIVPDPQPLFVPPQRFCARLDLPADSCDASLLLSGVQQLLRLLEGFLRGQGAGATALLLRAHHSPRRTAARAPTSIGLALAVPERDGGRLLELLRERLARVTLPDAAVALELELERMAPWTPVNAGFLPPAPQAAQTDALHLVETLHARLGSRAVFRLQAFGDHRPERAYRVVDLAPGAAAPLTPGPPVAQRPLLLLPVPYRLQEPVAQEPLPRYGGPLALLAGPERIEAGWWDLGAASQPAEVQRDYFVARNRGGQTLWIYRELAAPHAWFLHGLFA
jgi:protein ImuB